MGYPGNTDAPRFDYSQMMQGIEDKRKQDSIDRQNAIKNQQLADQSFYRTANNSQAGSAAMQQASSENRKSRGSFGGPGQLDVAEKFTLEPGQRERIAGAMQQESALLGQMKGQESAYDTAYTQALQGQEMAKTKTGVFQAGTAPQTIIGGAQGAGIEKTGKFKSMYGAGSMLPASWMQDKLDPSKVAAKVSGLEDRNAPGQLKIGGNTLTYSRSKFAAPTAKNSGLGKYAPLSQLTYT